MRDSNSRQLRYERRVLTTELTECWYERGDLNPHDLGPRILSPMRLPIPPRSLCVNNRDSQIRVDMEQPRSEHSNYLLLQHHVFS